MVKRSAQTKTLELLAAGKLKSVLLGLDDDKELEAVCSILNGRAPGELRLQLRKLVETWHRSGPNLARMLKENQTLFHRIRVGRTFLVPTNTGKGHLFWLPSPRDVEVTSCEHQALAHFMALVVSPKCHRLGGPCYRCRKYYVKKTLRQKAYCSRRCGSISTALATTRRKRDQEHRDKLERARKAIERWTSVRTEGSWKEWVAAQTGITARWLTRAVHAGGLKAPPMRAAKAN